MRKLVFRLLSAVVLTGACTLAKAVEPAWSKGSTPPIGGSLYYGNGGLRYGGDRTLGSTPPLGYYHQQYGPWQTVPRRMVVQPVPREAPTPWVHHAPRYRLVWVRGCFGIYHLECWRVY